MKYQQGDVISVPFPFTDLTNSKPRPALVISNDSVSNTCDLIIVMITSQHKSDGVNLEITSTDIDVVLPRQSFVRCHRLATIDEKIVAENLQQSRKSFSRECCLQFNH
ncbi:MAG: type II toxin-antitoxin system PemK/MazF family toxin [Chitinophagales bacterium]|nr:type II toxin-antitoxin system PemK/MazF family toxin [Chitinophagales bacterium]